MFFGIFDGHRGAAAAELEQRQGSCILLVILSVCQTHLWRHS